MKKWAYYNEIDPKAAAWIRELIKRGLVTDGEVDERSIVDVRPSDVQDFLRCHWFAGVAGWDYALRLAGWPDDRPVWTGSCPCQPFSAAGKRGGVADARHLWPEWFRLINECRPARVFGEQVASKDGLGWLDLVSADLEDAGYAIGAADLCAAGIGAPHIRQRFWFGATRLADGDDARLEGRGRVPERPDQCAVGQDGLVGGMADSDDARLEGRGGVPECPDQCAVGQDGLVGGMADSNSWKRTGFAEHGGDDCDGAQAGWQQRDCESAGVSATSGLADSDGWNASAEWQQRGGQHGLQSQDSGASGLEHPESNGWGERRAEPSGRGVASGCSISGMVNTGWPRASDRPWRDADWLFCRDGKWRPVESGTFPLATGLPGRVGLLRGYGNAIVPQVAAEFIQAFEEATLQLSTSIIESDGNAVFDDLF